MIVMENVCKTYKVAKRNAGFKEACKSLLHRETEEIKALSDVSFTIQDGEMVGYIGPNGAGKSSTIKILSGILTPDSGSCVIDGLIPWKNRIEHVKQIGVVFGQRSQLWWDIPVIDSFELLTEIYSIPKPSYNDKLEELTELLQLQELLKTPTRQLSLGQRMRCEIAASLLHSFTPCFPSPSARSFMLSSYWSALHGLPSTSTPCRWSLKCVRAARSASSPDSIIPSPWPRRSQHRSLQAGCLRI